MIHSTGFYKSSFCSDICVSDDLYQALFDFFFVSILYLSWLVLITNLAYPNIFREKTLQLRNCLDYLGFWVRLGGLVLFIN